jgi:hypothetical protein
MGTTQTDPRPAVPAAAVSLALAGCAALLLTAGSAFGFADANTEPIFTLSWLIGWVLLAWAGIAGAVATAQVLRVAASRRRPSLTGAALVALTAAIIVFVCVAHPLVGSGSGSG